MNRFRWAALAACVWLSGCANFAASGPGAGEPAASGEAGATVAPGARIDGAMPAVPVSELSGLRVATLETPADLWDRVRRGFAMPDLDGELVARHEEWYSTRPDYIERMVERSRLYIFHIVEELELRGMPTELALLPYIESAFNPQAVSSAKAAGMWQFMPGTGRDFQLQQNLFQDERRNVVNSTRAALDYLQKLHDMFGDWHLALAAYNWGQGNVKRAIERNQAAGLGVGYADLSMPAETRNYVPKLQAVKNIIAHPERFAAVLPLIENHPFFDTVDITRDIDVEVAARLADVRLEDFRALNPAQKKPVIFASGTPQILLPWNNAAVFKENLARSPNAQLASWTAWVAPEAMPSREAARRAGMDEDALREINGIPRGMMIARGSTLLVRRGGQAEGAVAPDVLSNARLAYTPEIVLKRTTVRARRGDTVWSLAERYDLPAGTVAGWNGLGPRASLKRGQAITLMLPVRAAAAAERESARDSAREDAKERAARSAAEAPHRGARGRGRPEAEEPAPRGGRGKANERDRHGKTDARDGRGKPNERDSRGKAAGRDGGAADAKDRASRGAASKAGKAPPAPAKAAPAKPTPTKAAPAKAAPTASKAPARKK